MLVAVVDLLRDPPSGLTDGELSALAAVVGRDVGDLGDELRRRLWLLCRRPRVPPIVGDVARRFRPARRFLNHLTDTDLHPLGPEPLIAA